MGSSNSTSWSGRVGRSDRRAYAYLLTRRPLKALPPVARKRLAAIKEFSEPRQRFSAWQRSTWRSAARGNLLGGQQSGHIEAGGLSRCT